MSTLLFVFLLPWIFLILFLLYGIGLLFVHELRVKHQLPTTNVILLGIVDGFLEEGLSLRSFFNPNWDISPLDMYGRVLGINLVWAASVTIYHLTMSIWIPLLLTDILFPEYQNKALLETKKQQLFAVTLFILSLLLFYVANPYPQPLLQYLSLILLSIFLLIIALKLPPSTISHQSPMISSSFRLFTSGFTGFFLWIVFSWGFPAWRIHWLASFLLLWLFPIIVVFLANGWNKKWSKRQQLILATGIVFSSLLIFPLLSEPIEQTLASILTIFLFWIRFRKTKQDVSLMA